MALWFRVTKCPAVRIPPLHPPEPINPKLHSLPVVLQAFTIVDKDATAVPSKFRDTRFPRALHPQRGCASEVTPIIAPLNHGPIKYEPPLRKGKLTYFPASFIVWIAPPDSYALGAIFHVVSKVAHGKRPSGGRRPGFVRETQDVDDPISGRRPRQQVNEGMVRHH